MKKSIILIVLFTQIFYILPAQTPNTHIQFESTNKGVLFPNVDSTTRKAMLPHFNETSLIVFDINLKKYMFWDGSTWKQVNNDQYIFPKENNVLIGERVGENLDFNTSMQSGRSNTIIGDLAGLQTTSGNRNTYVGDGSGRENKEGNASTAIGLFAGGGVEHLESSVVIGDLAAGGDDGPEMDSINSSVIIGNVAGRNMAKSNENVMIGYFTGINADSSTRNVYLGAYSGSNSKGSLNTFLGTNSGKNNTTGFINTFVGNGAGEDNTTGQSNTYVGEGAARLSTTGGHNTYIGKSAGWSRNGSYNVMIGRSAGAFNNTPVDSSVFIGYNAGTNTNDSHSLIIESGDQNYPLISGNFKTNKLELNGDIAIDGKVKITDFNYDNSNDSIVVRQNDGTLAIRDAATLACSNSTSPWYLGQDTLDGIVFYIYKGSDGKDHGLIVHNNESVAEWQSTGNLSNTDAYKSWDGDYNTTQMMSSPAKTYVQGLGTGWYLPSIDELSLLFQNRIHANKALNANFYVLLNYDVYWSSTEESSFPSNRAYDFNMSQGFIGFNDKDITRRVRAIRAF